jgi:RHS repeat-associated protein
MTAIRTQASPESPPEEEAQERTVRLAGGATVWGGGWYNSGYRDYSPMTMRFTTTDPIRSGGNWYQYVQGDPVNYIDPWGLEASDSAAMGLVAAAGAPSATVVTATYAAVVSFATTVQNLGTYVNTGNLADMYRTDATLRTGLGPDALRAINSYSSTSALEQRLQNMTVHSGVNMGAITAVTGTPAGMFSYGNDIFVEADLAGATRATISPEMANLLAHETVHSLQAETGGLVQFAQDYFQEMDAAKARLIALGNPTPTDQQAYEANRYEVEAYSVGGRRGSYLNSSGSTWMR